MKKWQHVFLAGFLSLFGLTVAPAWATYPEPAQPANNNTAGAAAGSSSSSAAAAAQEQAQKMVADLKNALNNNNTSAAQAVMDSANTNYNQLKSSAQGGNGMGVGGGAVVNLGNLFKNAFQDAVKNDVALSAKLSAAISGNTLEGGALTADLKTGDQTQTLNAAGVAANAGAGAGSNSGNVTIGGTLYSFPTVPVESARVSLATGPQPHNTGVTVLVTGCGPFYQVEEERRMQALGHAVAGLVAFRTDNGVVKGTRVTGNERLHWSPWEVVGYEHHEKLGNLLVQESRASGVQSVFMAYLAGSSAASGLNVNKFTEAGALGNSGGIQTLGKEIDLLPCEVVRTRKFREVVPPPPPPPVAAAAVVVPPAQQEPASFRVKEKEIEVAKPTPAACYRVDDKNPLSAKPKGMPPCSTKGGVRQYDKLATVKERVVVKVDDPKGLSILQCGTGENVPGCGELAK